MYLQGLRQSSHFRQALLPGSAVASQHAGQTRIFSLRDGRRLACSDYGLRQGLPLFYLPSHASTRLEGLFFHDSARSAGLRLLALDRPGLGLSDFVRVAHPQQVAEDVVAVADMMGIERFALLSWGGGDSFAFAVSQYYPHRVQLQVSVAPWPGAMLAASDAPWSRLLSTKMLRLMLQFRCQVSARLSGQDCFFERLREAVHPVDQQLLDDEDFLTIFRADLAEARRQGFCGIAQDACAGLSALALRPERINVPIQLWHGGLDRLTSAAYTHQLAERLPQASLHSCPGWGHLSPLRHTDELLRSIHRQLSTALAPLPASDCYA